jgi:hypothetical protein
MRVRYTKATGRGTGMCSTRPKAPAAGSAAESVTRFIDALPDPQRTIARRLRAIVLRAAPGIEESVKWGSPCYSKDGLVCAIMPLKSRVNFALYKGAHLTDPSAQLEGTGKDMRHVKLSTPGEIDARRLAAWVREGIALNRKARR